MGNLLLRLAFAMGLLTVTAVAGPTHVYVPAGAKAETERECSACHEFIPPQEEPMQEWRDIVRNLPNHMGENAELPEKLRSDIEAYLVANASDGPARRESRGSPQ